MLAKNVDGPHGPGTRGPTIFDDRLGENGRHRSQTVAQHLAGTASTQTVIITMTAVSVETATRVHPRARSRVGEGGRAARSAEVSKPGADAIGTGGASQPASVIAVISTPDTAAIVSVRAVSPRRRAGRRHPARAG
jgi:hypothetical protein